MELVVCFNGFRKDIILQIEVKNESFIHSHAIPNPYGLFSSVDHKRKSLEECSCSSFLYNEGGTVKLQKDKKHSPK